MESYTIVYVFGNLLMAFVIYKFMHIFYSASKINRVFENAAYLGYFICITITHIFLKIPTIVMLTNVVLLFLLTLLYEGSLKKSLLAVSSIYFSLMLVETLIAFLTSYLKLDPLKPYQYESEFGIILMRVSSYVLVLIVQGFKNVRNETPIPKVYWASLLAVPLSTVIMLYTILMCPNTPRIGIILCLVSSLGINLLTFYLYDSLSVLLGKQMNRCLEKEQRRFYEHQVEMMKAALDEMKVIRHDLKNKLSPLCSLAQAGRSDELLNLLQELTFSYNINQDYVQSGNESIDNIINYKLHQAKNQSILISTQITVPAQLDLPTFDVAAILGNLLDNAIEAATTANERWIELKLKYMRGCLLIEISNSYDGKVVKKAGRFLSRKCDRENHGLGLQSVQSGLKKYNGTMQIFYDDTKFTIKALLYI